MRDPSTLRLAGVAAYEGLMPTDGHALPAGIDDYLSDVAGTVRRLQGRGLLDPAKPPIITAGGSSYFDLVVDALGPAVFDFPVRTVIRSGCYATHDHGTYRRTSPWDGRGLVRHGCCPRSSCSRPSGHGPGRTA